MTGYGRQKMIEKLNKSILYDTGLRSYFKNNVMQCNFKNNSILKMQKYLVYSAVGVNQ